MKDRSEIDESGPGGVCFGNILAFWAEVDEEVEAGEGLKLID